MILLLNFSKKAKKFLLFFCILASLFYVQITLAQIPADTSKTLLASIEKNTESAYFIRKSNVVFPEILKGNEKEMLPYIENFSIKKRDYLNKMYTKGKGLLPKAANILKKYDLPEELKILLALESEYNGNAVSRSGAVGYWQIMDELANDYDMKYVTHFSKADKKRLSGLKGKNGEAHLVAIRAKDDRKNFMKATDAAARYLRDCKRSLDENWLLVVAGYNCGVGNVKKAIKKRGKINPTFWDIKRYLPSETRVYVMNFITLNVIFNNYEMFANNKLIFANEKIMLPDDQEKGITEIQPEYSDR